jgi:hypothetical protein
MFPYPARAQLSYGATGLDAATLDSANLAMKKIFFLNIFRLISCWNQLERGLKSSTRRFLTFSGSSLGQHDMQG